MNKLFIIGNLTRDPETRTTTSGVSVCSFSVAVSRRYSSSSGERQTDFFRVSAWRQLGETCQKYLAKGRKVAVVGELQPRLYEASDGTTRLSLEVNADEVEFLTPKGQQDDAPVYTAGGGSPKAAYEEFGFENVNDELPF
ncbi:MAG TPA: single-stranded DNA-binding protein [Clostridia bacterium]|nr:MAG: Single-stranded DNA-binding protein ssb [Firmicutes bacterium ADurb.Bin356]HOF94385.1 single-stranded DNA-binding protein [Clostridia bacterium]HOR13067.1 single-stranded DNA-binding protein [Clostridia bacterium]